MASDARKPPPSSALRPPPEQALKCPRCDSSNTKFCYYNNYSLAQPRHFCKTCRRYWTKGGALRNVPIGGGCRKNKKAKAGLRVTTSDSNDELPESSGLKFLHGISSSLDYQLGGLPFARLHSPGVFNQFFSFGDLSSNLTASTNTATATCSSGNLEAAGGISPLMGFTYPTPSFIRTEENDKYGGGTQEIMGPPHTHTNIASSIESLSSINQDLHWKLQQQRLAMLLGGDDQHQKESSHVSGSLGQQNQLPPISFPTAERSKGGISASNSRKLDGDGDNPSGWLFQSSCNIGGNGDNSGSNNNSSNWNETQAAWNDLHQYSASLP